MYRLCGETGFEEGGGRREEGRWWEGRLKGRVREYNRWGQAALAVSPWIQLYSGYM